MSTVQEIESAITKLPLEKKEAIRDWLDEAIEAQLEVSDEFKAKIQRARQEIAAGVHSMEVSVLTIDTTATPPESGRPRSAENTQLGNRTLLAGPEARSASAESFPLPCQCLSS
jgi:hypothetical protein